MKLELIGKAAFVILFFYASFLNITDINGSVTEFRSDVLNQLMEQADQHSVFKAKLQNTKIISQENTNLHREMGTTQYQWSSSEKSEIEPNVQYD